MRVRYLVLGVSVLIANRATAQSTSDSTKPPTRDSMTTVTRDTIMPPHTAMPVAGARTNAHTVAGEIALGDSAAAALAAPSVSLAHYKAALALDSTNYVALCGASRDAVAAAEFDENKTEQRDLFAEGERYARQAVAVKPNDPEGHFYLARALGRVALTKGKKDRVKYGKEVYEQAQEALKLNPNHPGALHVMGMWNAEVMSLSGFSRFMAKTFLGGGILGKVYLDTNQPDKARAQFELVLNGAPTEYNDRHYKEEAAQALEGIKK
ncbi:MAG TPA: hypothetical protein VFJ96_13430 [Gemmatimonadaceae bacterium]|nr:hypothetical protein [Gemmatimonadaceae bacterium]